MRKLVSILVVTFFLAVVSVPSYSGESSSIQGQSNAIVLQIGNPWMSIDNNPFPVDPANNKTEPETRNGRTFVPISPIVILLGGTTSWNEKDQKVTIDLDNHNVAIQIGSNIAIVDGVSRQIDVAPYISNSRTMMPLRFIIENLGYQVSWDPTSQKITIPLEDETDPVFDPAPLSSLKISQNIDSLLSIPYTELHVKEGQNLHSNIQQPDGIKEMMDLLYNGTFIRVIVFYSPEDAKRLYEFERDEVWTETNTISQKSGIGFNQNYITKVKRARSDPEGWYTPMSYSTCNAGFLKQNLVISFLFDIRDEDEKKDTVINDSINYVAELLIDKVN